MESFNFTTILTDIIKEIQYYLNKIDTKITIDLNIEVISEFLFHLGKFKTFINFITKIKRDEIIDHIQLRDYEFEDILNINETLKNYKIKNRLLNSQILSNHKNFLNYGFYHEDYENYYEEGNFIYPLLVEDLKTNQKKILDFTINNFEKEGPFWKIENSNNSGNKFTLIICAKFENGNFQKLSNIFDEVNNLKKINQLKDNFFRCILIFLTKSEEDNYRNRGIDLDDIDANKIGKYGFKEKSKKDNFMKLIMNYEISTYNNLKHENSELDYENIQNKIDFLKKIIPDYFEIFYCDGAHYINEKYSHFKHDEIYLISDQPNLIRKFKFGHINKCKLKSRLNKFLNHLNNQSEDIKNRPSKDEFIKLINNYIKILREMEFDTKFLFRNKNSFINTSLKIRIMINKNIHDFIVEEVFPVKISYEIDPKFKVIIKNLEEKMDFLDIKTSGSIYEGESIEFCNLIKNFESLILAKNELAKYIKFTYGREKQKIFDRENGLISVNNFIILTNEIDSFQFRFDDIIENLECSNNFFSKIKVLPSNYNNDKGYLINQDLRILEDKLANFIFANDFNKNTFSKIKIIKQKIFSKNFAFKLIKCIKSDYEFLKLNEMEKFNNLLNNFDQSDIFNLIDKKLIEEEYMTITIDKDAILCKLCSGLLKYTYSLFHCRICDLNYCEDCIKENSESLSDPHDLFFILLPIDSKLRKISFKINKLKLNDEYSKDISNKKQNIKNIHTYCNFCEEELNEEKFPLINEIEGNHTLFSYFCRNCIFDRRIQSKILSEIDSINPKLKSNKTAILLRKI